MRESGSWCRRNWSGDKDNRTVPAVCSVRHDRVHRSTAIHETNNASWIDQNDQQTCRDAFEPDDRNSGRGGRSDGRSSPSYLPACGSPIRTLEPDSKGGQ
jgi:hypothetical protein